MITVELTHEEAVILVSALYARASQISNHACSYASDKDLTIFSYLCARSAQYETTAIAVEEKIRAAH